jgi:hypothetical protein
MGRQDLHEALYATYARQQYAGPIELVVFDESSEPSPFFRALADPTVRYFHQPAPPSDGVTHIGRARNILSRLAQGEVCVVLDDDDNYEPAYTTTLVDRMQRSGADIVHLSRWRCWHADTDSIFEWNTREMGGTHWVVVAGEEPTVVDLGPEDVEPMLLEAYALGFFFCTCFRRQLALKIPFPDAGTEDYPWVKKCLKAGARIELVDDCSDLVLHTVARSQSMHFPQKRLGQLRAQMLGSIASMYELPEGKDIHVEPGVRYSVLASIKKNHTLRSIEERAKSWGLVVHSARDNVDPSEFGVKAPSGKYRLVHFEGEGGAEPMKIPWRASKLFFFDKSGCVKAWSSKAPTVGAGAINEQLMPRVV